MPDKNSARLLPELFPNREPVHSPFNRPLLCVVVDTEEDFGWDVPLSPDNTGVTSVTAQHRAQTVFSRFGITPTYLLTYPVASDPLSVSVLREFLRDGVCELGAHLHPWVTPPGGRATDEALSFPGNLPERLEREKLRVLTNQVRDTFAVQPITYKAGRYGFGARTAGLLQREGFLIDTSLMPRTSYAEEGGPDYHDYDCLPFWFGTERRLLELPVNRALTGALGGICPNLYRRTDRTSVRRMRVGSLLARSRLLERITLSPEGNDLPAMRRLTRTLLRRGQRIFTLQYHSPSLAPGNTPYVRSERDLSLFLDRLAGFLSFFRDEIAGEFATPREIRDRLLNLRSPAPDRARCLVVANTFPPVHGGSAIVYDSLARFGAGRVSVLAPVEQYRDGTSIAGVEAYDRAAPFRVHRIRRLRTRLVSDDVVGGRRAANLLQDLALRWDVLRTIRRIVRTEKISVVCVGELVAGGWLAPIARQLFGVRCIIYVHGEEITVNSGYDATGRRRRRALAAADGIVAVSRFTRTHLIGVYAVPAEKITLISNGVDVARFTPRPRRTDLQQRLGLHVGPVLLTVGRLCARKGMDRVIEALPLLRERFPSLRYLIVGEGPYRAELQRLAQTLNVSGMVVFAGGVTDGELADHYAVAHVFIMANRTMPDGDTEGFGLVFLEANAVGLPVIAGRAGGSVDAVAHGVNGLLVDGDDRTSIASAVTQLLEDEPLRTAIAARGLEAAHAASWELRVAGFLDYCDRLASSTRA